MTDCPLCTPSPQTDILFQDDFCRVILLNDTDYPAYCRIELLAHVKEMTDMPPESRARMMKTVFAVETAMREVIKPDKINLASLGNKTPHLHWHVIPRFENDKHFPNSHWGDVTNALQTNKTELSLSSKLLLQDKIKAHIACSL